MKIKVQHRQTVSDIAIQVYGDIRGIASLMEANGIGATDELQPGTMLECPETVYDRYMQTYVDKEGICPATAGSCDEIDY